MIERERLSVERLLLVTIPLLVATVPLCGQTGDAESGKSMLEVRHCTVCHPVSGEGGGSAPDLAKVSARDASPADLAATMWNHGPRMWEAMDEEELPIPNLSPYEIANLYAYFYSQRYFDPPGVADRGEQVFREKHCGRCHGLKDTGTELTGPPVASWVGVANRVDWLQQMWNHGAEMAEEMERLGLAWPEFTLQEMTDLLTYLEDLPDLGLVNPGFRMGEWSEGEKVFEDRACAECHTIGEDVEGKVDLLATAKAEPRLSGLAVDMWNHRPRMETEAAKRGISLEPFEAGEMENLLAYLFEQGYFEVQGNAQRGTKLVKDKGCASCHGQSGSRAPQLQDPGQGYSAIDLASAVWIHGPGMKDMIDYRGQDWPTMTAQDIADLVTYINAE